MPEGLATGGGNDVALSARTARKRVRVSVAVLIAVALLCAAPSAYAAQRYAAPSPSGAADCSSPSNACDISTAITAAGANDEVIVEPGVYGSPTPIATAIFASAPNLFIHGVDGLPPPRIHFASGAFLVLGGSGERGHHLDIEGVDDGFEVNSGAQADEITAHISNGGALDSACTVYGTLIDSVCWAEGTGASGLLAVIGNITVTLTLRNVTLFARGTDSHAIFLKAEDGGHLTAVADNTIARAVGQSGAVDVDVETDSNPSSIATLTPDHSNFASTFVDGAGASVTPSATNQTAQAPLFRDAMSGDFHQAPGSPTIDHGANDPANGPSDFEGDPRAFNGTTDIGADEFLPAPTALTGPAMAVSATGATLTGSVNPRGVPTTYRFVYGKTAAYGQSTPVKVAGSGTASQPRSAAIAGLKPATTYHFRIEALSKGGKTVGADRTFTTVDPFTGVILKNQSVVVKKGKAPIKVGCPAITPPPCHGTLKLTFRRTTIDALGHKHKKKIKLGSASFSMGAGKTVKVKVKLRKAALILLGLRKSLKTKGSAKATDGAGKTRTKLATIKLKPPHTQP